MFDWILVFKTISNIKSIGKNFFIFANNFMNFIFMTGFVLGFLFVACFTPAFLLQWLGINEIISYILSPVPYVSFILYTNIKKR